MGKGEKEKEVGIDKELPVLSRGDAVQLVTYYAM